MFKPANQFYEFGPFRVDAQKRLLLREGEPVPLTPKALDILLALLARQGEVLSKEELMQAVWPDVAVEENNLTRNISTLRKALGEKPNEHCYVVTIPGSGYRFVAAVAQPAAEVQEQGVQASASLEPSMDKLKPELPAPAPSMRAPSGRMLLQARLGAVALVAVVIVAAGAFYLREVRAPQPGKATPPIRTIAVLPFKPLDAARREEVLELGMADTLISKLGGLQQLVIRPVSSIRKYAALDQDPLAAGREQRVDAVLEGSLQWNGGKVRVTARLLYVADGKLLWTHRCEEDCTDIFAVQDAISEQMARALALQLTGEQQQQLDKRYTNNLAAYQDYLLGRFHWNNRGSNEERIRKAITCFQQAITKDPNYALAYAGVADCQLVLFNFGFGEPQELCPSAKAYAEKALALDETLAEARTTLACLKGWYEWDWPGAERELKRVIEFNAGYSSAHQRYALLLSHMRRGAESLVESRRALELEPLSLTNNVNLGRALGYEGQYDQAIRQLHKTQEIEPHYLGAHLELGKVYLEQGKHAEALLEFNKMAELSRFPALAVLGHTYALAGEKDKARQLLAELHEVAKQRFVSPLDFAAIHTGLGEKEQAFAWLEKGFQMHAGAMGYLKAEPLFYSLRAEPYFQDLLRRIGLSQ